MSSSHLDSLLSEISNWIYDNYCYPYKSSPTTVEDIVQDVGLNVFEDLSVCHLDDITELVRCAMCLLVDFDQVSIHYYVTSGWLPQETDGWLESSTARLKIIRKGNRLCGTPKKP